MQEHEVSHSPIRLKGAYKMDLEEMLLFYSFSQIRGVSARKENDYWSAGETLRSLAESLYDQQSFFSTSNGDVDRADYDAIRSISALQHGNATFFQDRLEHKHYYRIAYSFPSDVMFLDIETTGLSTVYHYVTCAGWMLNGAYGYWLQGTDPKSFLSAFRAAKMIVTFNGTMFDCKFLDNMFHVDEFSQKMNLDLMFLCRRFGLKGGQKEIERHIGFSRPESLKETDGKEAIALWYSFLFGKRASLKRLIEYNFYDILGMTYILDWVFFKRIYGQEFPKLGNPHPFFSGNITLKRSVSLPSSAACADIRAFVKHNISDFSRDLLRSSNPYRIVGIDLAGKTSSRTGLCLLKGTSAQTKVAHTDEDIVQFIQETQPDLISIDAPLSLPKGRTSVYDDDPERERAGILRHCERELKRRNVNSYPALIRSMQELTKRGIHLAEHFRKSGYPVIECFPGAAQDVVQLPRKRTDESLLKQGLSKFGVRGGFRRHPVCHDELDAITASLVGQFFISGYYEPLGIPEENDMIIPQKKYRPAPHDLVIGLTGLPAAGKTSAGKYLESFGYTYIRYSQIIEQELSDSGCSANRNDLRVAGASLYHDNHQYDLNKKLSHRIAQNPKVVVDGMRHLEDYTFWKEQCFLRFVLIYIDAEYELRQKRFCIRGDELSDYDKAVSHPAEAEVTALKGKANYIIENNGTLDDLYAAVRDVLSKLNFS